MNLNNSEKLYIPRLLAFLDKFKIEPKNITLYITAFTHGSYINNHKKVKSYELLEFIGDSIINLYSSKLIFNYLMKNKNYNPGIATELRSNIVKNQTLADLALNNNMQDLLRHEISDLEISNKNKIFGDIFEALVGAIYYDQGSEEVYNYLNIILKPTIKQEFLEINNNKSHPKSMFQTLVQSNKKIGIIKYFTHEVIIDKKVMFESTLSVSGMIFGVGIGKTKRDAETQAAILGLKKYTQNTN
ncbi:ribonuclease III domain-containing protein [Mycoplasma phocimorsus]|uniref:ribonuclease III domain-containing protein n=1 Tax=Mycoplasma phocimorsus TaxID=3045839 RepID=UPI0024BFE722|nr:ribonuclease III domain-containing protein [Mycoplasma phocimorsus]MDJ1647255.1 ribonuclease III domain-containing protein [Mycoplasma phocimorsus]